ncbi:MFS transporter, PAT family, beta-lactamase induction signal transducer AmpG [Candidatus Xenohaliotis californiensis]|uniref:MFS transporter, PAT family, beta-lactamase induction signal transducer AmpG n=2 Tax=Candidatus Xenohaliotis californiensis TaxID=84677 RepID=A0ABM9N8K1_9RICK|nr:MFS transporter, PAT family, beta-lactamase induction signal transducer AmpG [Candidatus Xenohaliotis californiensis]
MLLKNFKIYLSKEIFIVFLMGIASAIPLTLLGSTLSAWLNDYGISKKTIGLFAMIGLPFSIKFAWAPIVDNIRIPIIYKIFGKRCSWLALIQIMIAAAIMTLGMHQLTVLDGSIKNIALHTLVIAFLAATQDIIVDAYRVELLSTKQQAAGSATAVFGYRIGMLISGAFTLMLVDFLKNLNYQNAWNKSYIIISLVMIIILTAILLLSEKQENEIKSEALDPKSIIKWLTHSLVEPLKDIVKRKHWILILILIASFKLGDAFATSLFTPFLRDLGFSLMQIGMALKIFGMIATIIGGFLGGTLAYKINLMNAILLCGIVQSITNLVYIAQHHIGNNIYMLYTTISIENIAGGMGTAVFVAYISMLCNKKYTATQYALLTSVASIGRTTLASSSGFVVDAFGWDVFFLISIVLTIPGISILLFFKHQQNYKTKTINTSSKEQPA